MTIHKEGKASILISGVLMVSIIVGMLRSTDELQIILGILSFGALVLLALIIWFFRFPNRVSTLSSDEVICPADGKVVVIEKTTETEYFKDERIQISIFMSPLNVHAQWYPINGLVSYTAYHKGKYLVAWHPKSSTLNERSTVVVKDDQGREILIRQIAGAVARRIVTYSKLHDKAEINQQLGFIKFGSRVDVFLPLDALINVKIDDKVVGNQTLLAKL